MSRGIKSMQQSWRWFGPNDPVTLGHALQAGASGIVTALHDAYDGRVWSVDNILARKRQVEAAGLEWVVCESIPMNDAIKMRSGRYRHFIDNWKDTLANLGRAGIPIVCYNFMPVLDWVRTDLLFQMPSTGYAVRFDRIDFAAYDVLVLKRPGADQDYDANVLALAEKRASALGVEGLLALENTIIGNFPAREDVYDRDKILGRLAEFSGMDPETLRSNLLEFLGEVLPVAQEFGVRLGIHADDPPFSLFGLPRIVSTVEDTRAILGAYDIPENGITLCTGSYGARADNDLVAIAREFAPRIHFAHLRNVTREDHGSFHESDHLGGDTDMVAVVGELLMEERRRRESGRSDHTIPMRPDHGHLLADDIGKVVNPGYSCIGRLKGLAELRGVMQALAHPDRDRVAEPAA